MLHIKNIEKYYGSKNNVTKALDRISFDVEDGEFIAIMGASGSGKTTLLNCISTIDTASAGSILLDGENITEIPSGELARFRRRQGLPGSAHRQGGLHGPLHRQPLPFRGEDQRHLRQPPVLSELKKTGAP